MARRYPVPMQDLEKRAQRLAEALATVDASLDWEALGHLYCHEGGEHFFPPEQRDAIRDTALQIAGDLGALLTPKGRSHYVGAAVAEIPLVLFERLVLEREVHWSQLPGEEFDRLRAALKAVGGPTPTTTRHPEAKIDHLWCVSVFTDPVVFPSLHDSLYGEPGRGIGDRRRELAQAERLIGACFDLLTRSAVLSTTEEEAPLFLAACEQRGWELTFPERGRTTGIVGDVVRHGTVVRDRK